MIVPTIGHTKIIAKLDHLDEIYAFIQGAVYCWCRNNKYEDGSNMLFSVRDLFAGPGTSWKTTPLYELRRWHEIHYPNFPPQTAAKDLNFLLKDVLIEDVRVFRTVKYDIRHYVWTGKEQSNYEE